MWIESLNTLLINQINEFSVWNFCYLWTFFFVRFIEQRNLTYLSFIKWSEKRLNRNFHVSALSLINYCCLNRLIVVQGLSNGNLRSKNILQNFFFSFSESTKYSISFVSFFFFSVSFHQTFPTFNIEKS